MERNGVTTSPEGAVRRLMQPGGGVTPYPQGPQLPCLLPTPAGRPDLIEKEASRLMLQFRKPDG